jgi:hypothetical protein
MKRPHPGDRTWVVLATDPDDFETIDRDAMNGAAGILKRLFEQRSLKRQQTLLDLLLPRCARGQANTYVCECQGFQLRFWVYEQQRQIIIAYVDDPNTNFTTLQ